MKLLCTLVLASTTIFAAAQSNYLTTGKGNGNWNNPGTWQLAPGSAADNDGIPDANDNVTVQSGHTLIVNQNQACKNLVIGDDGDFTELVIVASGQLDIADKLTVNSPTKTSEVYIGVHGTLNAGSTTVNKYDNDISLDLKVAPTASFIVAAQHVKSIADLTSGK